MAPRERQLKASDARLWLQCILHEGPMPAGEILELAKLEGIPERGLYRAKRHLKVASVKTGGGYQGRGARWMWKCVS
jgi:hypothetical protein